MGKPQNNKSQNDGSSASASKNDQQRLPADTPEWGETIFNRLNDSIRSLDTKVTSLIHIKYRKKQTLLNNINLNNVYLNLIKVIGLLDYNYFCQWYYLSYPGKKYSVLTISLSIAFVVIPIYQHLSTLKLYR